MAQRTVPTKSNLLSTKKSLSLANVGYELLDRKRNILIREMMMLIDKASEIQDEIDNAFEKAYKSLQLANITLGYCENLSKTIPLENSLKLKYRSVMGVEIPIINFEKKPIQNLYYGLVSTNNRLDEAVCDFMDAKYKTILLAEIENSVYRLAYEIKKTQKRANSLKNILIPRFENDVKFITNALSENEREEFSRLKVIKNFNS